MKDSLNQKKTLAIASLACLCVALMSSCSHPPSLLPPEIEALRVRLNGKIANSFIKKKSASSHSYYESKHEEHIVYRCVIKSDGVMRITSTNKWIGFTLTTPQGNTRTTSNLFGGKTSIVEFDLKREINEIKIKHNKRGVNIVSKSKDPRFGTHVEDHFYESYELILRSNFSNEAKILKEGYYASPVHSSFYVAYTKDDAEAVKNDLIKLIRGFGGVYDPYGYGR